MTSWVVREREENKEEHRETVINKQKKNHTSERLMTCSRAINSECMCKQVGQCIMVDSLADWEHRRIFDFNLNCEISLINEGSTSISASHNSK